MPRKLSYKYLPTSPILFITKPPRQGEKGRRRREFEDFSWRKEAGGEGELRQSSMRAKRVPCRNNRVLQQRSGVFISVMNFYPCLSVLPLVVYILIQWGSY